MLLSAGRLLLSAGCFFLPEGERDGCGVGELRGFAEEAGAAIPGDCAGDGGAWVSLGEGAGDGAGLAERHTELNAVGGGGGCVAPLSPAPALDPSSVHCGRRRPASRPDPPAGAVSPPVAPVVGIGTEAIPSGRSRAGKHADRTAVRAISQPVLIVCQLDQPKSGDRGRIERHAEAEHIVTGAHYQSGVRRLGSTGNRSGSGRGQDKGNEGYQPDRGSDPH
jgi:hypothetical protein